MHKRIMIPLLVAAVVAGCESVKSTLAPVGVALKPVTDLVSNGGAAELYVSVSSVAINEKPSGSSAVVTNVGYASAVRVHDFFIARSKAHILFLFLLDSFILSQWFSKFKIVKTDFWAPPPDFMIQ